MPKREEFTVYHCGPASPVQEAEPWGPGAQLQLCQPWRGPSTDVGHTSHWISTAEIPCRSCAILARPAAMQQDNRLLPFTPPSPAEQTDEPGLVHNHRWLGPQVPASATFHILQRGVACMVVTNTVMWQHIGLHTVTDALCALGLLPPGWTQRQEASCSLTPQLAWELCQGSLQTEHQSCQYQSTDSQPERWPQNHFLMYWSYYFLCSVSLKKAIRPILFRKLTSGKYLTYLSLGLKEANVSLLCHDQRKYLKKILRTQLLRQPHMYASPAKLEYYYPI